MQVANPRLNQSLGSHWRPPATATGWCWTRTCSGCSRASTRSRAGAGLWPSAWGTVGVGAGCIAGCPGPVRPATHGAPGGPI